MTSLLVTSVGGHLTQLKRLLPSMCQLDAQRTWVTFDTPQSRSMLAGEDVIYLDYTRPRDVKNVLRHTLTARRLFSGSHPFSTVISTGSGIALSFLPLGRLRGASCHYIESFTRSSGPSLTGRLLSHVPGISLYAQFPGWATEPWSYAGSVFDTFAAGEPTHARTEIRTAVVTLGTMQDYQFRALVERSIDVLGPSVEVLWQVGCTDVSGLPIDAHSQIPAHELASAIEAADVVIAHAGCGSAIAALEAGKKPVLIARRESHGENVDDHQALLADELARRELAIVRGVDDLTSADLRLAASSHVRCDERPPPFRLRL
jgi:UDP-N-acetylglucosamine transferase subunit ALG13